MKNIILALVVILVIGCGLYLILTTDYFIKNQVTLSFSNNKKASFISSDVWIKNIDSIPLPTGFERITSSNSSFAFYLQHLPLKKDKTVYLFNGQEKRNQKAQFAVINMSIGSQDLQQCADAVMRLRAEYFYAKGETDSIVFKDNNGKIYKLVKGSSRKLFDAYLNTVFGMCGSYSLSMQLQPKAITAMQIGDVLIHGGFPGHAVIVVDMAENKQTKEKIFMIAQSYMPAQDVHVLINPYKPTMPWYDLNNDTKIYTPEYIFTSGELKKW